MPPTSKTESDQTSVRLYRSTAKELHDRKDLGESYDDVIRRLLGLED